MLQFIKIFILFLPRTLLQQALLQKERLAAQLRTLGVDPDML
jgi:hypothetical protein